MEEKPSWLISDNEASKLNNLLSDVSQVKNDSGNRIPHFPLNPGSEENNNVPQLPSKDFSNIGSYG